MPTAILNSSLSKKHGLVLRSLDVVRWELVF